MDKRIRDILDYCLRAIKDIIKNLYPEVWEAEYQFILNEISKIRKDTTKEATDGKYPEKLFWESYWHILQYVNLKENRELDEAVCNIGFLLDKSHPEYNFTEIDKDSNAELVYFHILGDIAAITTG